MGAIGDIIKRANSSEERIEDVLPEYELHYLNYRSVMGYERPGYYNVESRPVEQVPERAIADIEREFNEQEAERISNNESNKRWAQSETSSKEQPVKKKESKIRKFLGRMF